MTVLSYTNAFPGIPVPQHGLPGVARSFNGSSDYIDIGTHTWDPTTSATFSHWVYINALPSSYAGFISSADPNYFEWYLKASGGVACYFHNNWSSGNLDPVSGVTLSTGQWYNLLWTISGGASPAFTLYVNGTAFGPFSGGLGASIGNSSSLDAWIGQDIRVAGRFFNGYMSDIALWNTVLSSTQIANIAAGQRANSIGANANLVLYLPILGQSPESDFSATGANGVLTGTSVVSPPPALSPLVTTGAQNFIFPGAVQPKSTKPTVLSYTNAFPGIPAPQHLAGQTKVQSFLFSGALQPPPQSGTTPFSFTQVGAAITRRILSVGY